MDITGILIGILIGILLSAVALSALMFRLWLRKPKEFKAIMLYFGVGGELPPDDDEDN